LNIPASAVVISKGTHADREQYSTLYGLDAAGRTENILLKESGAGRIFIAGLATDYCVLNSVRDACKEGFEVIILEDAICAVDVSPGDGARAVAEMIRLGAKITTTDSVRREK
jgi:nicotinamidase/pyrazinamidase